MEEEIIKKVDPSIKDLGLHVSRVYTEVVEGVKNLNIEVDSDSVIDIDRITEASKIINDVIDSINIPMDNYVLDVHSKEKGDT